MKNYLKDKKGAALIISYLVIATLLSLAGIYLSQSITEIRSTEKFLNSSQAFWAAEAGLANTIYCIKNDLPLTENTFISLDGSKDFQYNVDASDTLISKKIYITGSAGTAENQGISQKTIQAELESIALDGAFKNTLSCGGNMNIYGLASKLKVYGLTRISGKYSQPNSKKISNWFEDKKDKVDTSLTTISIPDFNQNKKANEFNDFVTYFDTVVGNIRKGTLNDPDIKNADAKAVYIKTDGYYFIYPRNSLKDKEIIYVRGSKPGKGNVYIIFDATWKKGQDLTVVATGNVTYLQPLQYKSQDSWLNIICWGDYNEAAFYRSTHNSITHTHNNANYIDLFDKSSSTGNVIANGNINFSEYAANREFNYSSRVVDGDTPPGFRESSGFNILKKEDLIMEQRQWKEDILED